MDWIKPDLWITGRGERVQTVIKRPNGLVGELLMWMLCVEREMLCSWVIQGKRKSCPGQSGPSDPSPLLLRSTTASDLRHIYRGAPRWGVGRHSSWEVIPKSWPEFSPHTVGSWLHVEPESGTSAGGGDWPLAVAARRRQVWVCFLLKCF